MVTTAKSADYLGNAGGHQRVLAAGHTDHEAPALNLAEVRRLGATLGANEVHVHMLADGTNAAKIIEHDLREGQFTAARRTTPKTRH